MRKTFVILLVFACAQASFGQPSPDTLWTRTYGGSSYDYAFSVQQTADGGYIVAGGTRSFGAGYEDSYLVKTNSQGDTLWTRTYGGWNDDYTFSVHQTADGGYIMAGTTGSFGVGSVDFYLVRADSQGDTLWTRTYGGSNVDEGLCSDQTADGGNIVGGYTMSFGAGSADFYLVKTDSAGDTLWTRTYGGSEWDMARSVQQTIDGGYIVAGTTGSFGAGGNDFYLVKTNSSGDTLWTRTYGGSNDDCAFSVQQTADGGYIVAGYTNSFGAGSYDFYLVKTNSQGDTLWTRTYGGSYGGAAYSVHETTDGGYIAAGNDFYLVRTNNQGDTLWTRTYGGASGDERAWSIQLTADGGYVVGGWTDSFGAGDYDFYLVKTGPEAPTQLSGSLSGPYGPGVIHITGDIWIDAGNTATLAPGTTFMFDGPYPFRVYGTLLVEGTEADSIVFTTDTLTNPGRWRGLRFEGAGSSGSRLAYCVIEKGYATGNWPDNCGGGVFCSSSSPRFANCVIRDNRADYRGGGVASFSYSSPTITNCVIDSNIAVAPGGGNPYNAGGGLYFEYSNGSLINSIVSHNSAWGAGGGIGCDYWSSPSLDNCVFDGNASGETGGLWIVYFSAPMIRNCDVLNSHGYGVRLGDSNARISNTVVAYSDSQGISFAVGSTAQLLHCDFFGNAGGDFEFDNNDHSYGPEGIGSLMTTNANGDSCDQYFNIFRDPMFVDTANGDYHLLSESPCIDAGNPCELDPDNTILDIGAYYFPHSMPDYDPSLEIYLCYSVEETGRYISWRPFANAMGYRVYRSTQVDLPLNQWQLLTTTPPNIWDYLDSEAYDPAMRYFYRVVVLY